MLAKQTKWTICYELHDDVISIVRDTTEEVFAFLLKESAKPGYSENQYSIFPPNTNLGVMDLERYGLPAALTHLYASPVIQ